MWSPDSKHFAIIVTDSRKVKDLWVINAMASPRPTLETYKYEMPGEKDVPQDHLYIFDMIFSPFGRFVVLIPTYQVGWYYNIASRGICQWFFAKKSLIFPAKTHFFQIILKKSRLNDILFVVIS